MTTDPMFNKDTVILPEDTLDLAMWGINNFPRKLKNEFLGACKTRGSTGKAVLISLIRQYLEGVNEGRTSKK